MRGAPVQERRAAARRAGNEDRRRERARQDCPILALLVREDQKRRKQPLQVPARRETPECDSDASLWRLEVRAPSASIRRGSASGVPPGAWPWPPRRSAPRRKPPFVVVKTRAGEPVGRPG